MINWRDPRKEIPLCDCSITTYENIDGDVYIGEWEYESSRVFPEYIKAWCFPEDIELTVPENLRGNNG